METEHSGALSFRSISSSMKIQKYWYPEPILVFEFRVGLDAVRQEEQLSYMWHRCELPFKVETHREGCSNEDAHVHVDDIRRERCLAEETILIYLFYVTNLLNTQI